MLRVPQHDTLLDAPNACGYTIKKTGNIATPGSVYFEKNYCSSVLFSLSSTFLEIMANCGLPITL